MFNVFSLFDRRRNRSSTDGRKQREKRFLRLAFLLAIAIAVAFGAILYTINTNGRL